MTGLNSSWARMAQRSKFSTKSTYSAVDYGLRLENGTRKWLASKLKPKKYGDKITTEHTGTVGLSDMSQEALDAKIKELERKLKGE
jgi:hypothetical protein